MAGRKPIEIDPVKVEELAADGFAEYQIAQGLGVCWNTFNARRKENPEIDEALKRGQQAALGKVENALYASAVQGNLGA